MTLLRLRKSEGRKDLSAGDAEGRKEGVCVYVCVCVDVSIYLSITFSLSPNSHTYTHIHTHTHTQEVLGAEEHARRKQMKIQR